MAEGPLSAQRRLVHALRQQLGARLIETHISYVLLAGGQAYKVKKAVDLGFADFRSLAQRRAGCEEELRLNRRTAPELYQRVRPLTGSPAQPRIGGRGAAQDWLLQMRAFDPRGLWDRLAARGQLGPTHIDALVQVLVDFHARAAVAAPASEYGRPAQLRAPMLDNLRVLGQLCRGPGPRTALARLARWEADTFAALRGVFRQRRAADRVRDAHGDLHLGNVTQHQGRTVLFDCLEFSADLRWTDVMSDVAFMAMDLQAHGLAPLAHRFVNGYIERSGDAQGLRVLRYYSVHRALVRAKVAALRAAQLPPDTAAAHAAEHSMRHYLRLALQCIEPVRPVLMLTHGFSGSGKTLLTQSLLEAGGALRFRADVERKRLAGLQPLQRVRGAALTRLYGPAMDNATQARLRTLAALALRSGRHVILDGTFLRRRPRRQARQLAQRLGTGFVLIDFQAPLACLQQRVAARARRADDASDAGLAVLQMQRLLAEPLDADEQDCSVRFDAARPYDAKAMPRRWAVLLRQLR